MGEILYIQKFCLYFKLKKKIMSHLFLPNNAQIDKITNEQKECTEQRITI